MAATGSASNQSYREKARGLLRQWLSSDDSDLLASVDSLGARAVSAASDATLRLGRSASASQDAEKTLENLQKLATGMSTQKRRPWSLLGRGGSPDEEMHTRVEALVLSLDSERNSVARALILIDSDSKKLEAAASALEDALLLIRACAAAVDAAARELRFDHAQRAHFLNESVLPRLLAREHDVATQAAVTQQGVLTLRLLDESQQALAQAILRAREISVAALRTAIAARGAVARGGEIARQAEALAQTVRAAEQTPGPRRDLQRVLDDAVEQARLAIDAAQATQSSTPL